MPLSSVGYEGQSVSIDCQVEGKPQPEVTWEFNNQPIGAVFGTRARLDSPTRLTVHNLQVSGHSFNKHLRFGTVSYTLIDLDSPKMQETTSVWLTFLVKIG